MQSYRKRKSTLSFTAKILAVCVVAGFIYHVGFSGGAPDLAKKAAPDASAVSDAVKDKPSLSEAAVDLTPSQLNAIRIEPVGTQSFRVEKKAVGSVAYHEKEAADDTDTDDALATDSEKKFIVANVSESDSPFIHIGQLVEAKVVGFPDRVWNGEVSALGGNVWDSGGNPALDPATHRITVRCAVADPKNELYPGMLATVAVQVQEPVESVAVPVNGVVRKGDGTMTVWVTTDRRHFTERAVEAGLRQDGYAQITEGVKSGELVVTDGAIFLNNILYAPPSD